MRAPFQVLVIPYRRTAARPEFAVLKRSDDGAWQFVAGGGEIGEALFATARREIIVLLPPTPPQPRARLAVGRLRKSGLIGLWQDRDDIGDSSVYARQLREQAQKRGDIQ